ncbi:hypothetical protein IW150_005145, partial [Coemansia sp. RSA 2607]
MAGKKRSGKPKTQDSAASASASGNGSGAESAQVTSPAKSPVASGPGSPVQGNFEGPPTKVANSSYLTGSDPSISGDGTEVVKTDGYLEDHRDYFGQRFAHFKRWVRDIEVSEGGIDKFSRG